MIGAPLGCPQRSSGWSESSHSLPPLGFALHTLRNDQVSSSLIRTVSEKELGQKLPKPPFRSPASRMLRRRCRTTQVAIETDGRNYCPLIFHPGRKFDWNRAPSGAGTLDRCAWTQIQVGPSRDRLLIFLAASIVFASSS